MSEQEIPGIAQLAAIIGDAARAKILIALMGGKALSAGELSIEAEVTAQTTSSHLGKLVENNLISVQKQGRHKYFQIKNRHVAALIESMLNVSSNIEHSKVVTGPKDPDLRHARVCYDHLAGEQSVRLFDSLLVNKYIQDRDGLLKLSDLGKFFFNGLGADLDKFATLKRPVCRSCLDWSERRFHIAGSVGSWVLNNVLEHRWASKDPDSRVVRFSSRGLSHFHRQYEIT